GRGWDGDLPSDYQELETPDRTEVNMQIKCMTSCLPEDLARAAAGYARRDPSSSFHDARVGDWLDVQDAQGNWWPAIVSCITSTMCVHFIGWPCPYDSEVHRFEWTDRVRPFGAASGVSAVYCRIGTPIECAGDSASECVNSRDKLCI